MIRIAMIRTALLAFAIAAVVQPATAGQTAMTAEAFERHVTGRTLTFGIDGVPYGIEEFRQGRRTTWAFIGEQCREGIWFEQDGYICFTYQSDPDTHCWQFFLTDEGMRARFAGDPPDSAPYEIAQSPRPLICPGPEVGA